MAKYGIALIKINLIRKCNNTNKMKEKDEESGQKAK